MKKLFSVLLLNIIIATHILAQQNKVEVEEYELLTSNANNKVYQVLVQEIKEYFAAGDYYKVIKTLGSIHDGNPIFDETFIPLCNSLYGTGNIETLIETVKPRINNPNAPYYLYANEMYVRALIAQKDFSAARTLCNQMLKADPNQYIFEYLNGYAFFKQNDLKKSIVHFQKSLLMNPYNNPSHGMLGSAYLAQGRITESFLVLYMSLLHPMSRLENFDNKKLLLEIVNVDDEINTIYKERTLTEGYLFNAFDSLLITKSALSDTANKQGNNKLPQALQLDAVLSNMMFNKDIPNFVNQYYLPLLLELHEQDFEACNYLLFKNSGIDSLSNYTIISNDRIDLVEKRIINYYNRIMGTKELLAVKRYTLPLMAAYHKKNNEIVYGPVSISENQQAVYGNGILKFYNTNMQLMQEGEFYNGWKVGLWYVYDSITGRKTMDQQYFNNYPSYQKEYLNNGFYAVSNGNTNNEYEKKYYNYADVIEESILMHPYGYVSNYYWPTGELKNTYNKTHGKPVNTMKLYYPDKNIFKKIQYDNKPKTISTITYDQNGTIISDELKSSFDKAILKKLEYWNNAQLKIEHIADNNNTNNYTIQEYYPNGSKKKLLSVTNKKRNGTFQSFDPFLNKVVSEIIFEADKPRSYTIYNEKGEVSASGSYPLNTVQIKSTFNGIMDTYQLNEFGYINGDANSMFENGMLESKFNNHNFLKNGLLIGYYPNGNIAREVNYNNGELAGSFILYSPFNKISLKSNYINGIEYGIKELYYLDGNIKLSYFINDDKINGTVVQYLPTGIITSKTKFLNSYFQSIETFDKYGKLIDSASVPKATGMVVLKHENGNKYLEFELKNNKLIDGVTYYYNNGQIKLKTIKDFLFDPRENEKQYFPDGTLKSTVTNSGDSLLEYLSNGFLRKKIVKNEFENANEYYLLNKVYIKTVSNIVGYGELFHVYNNGQNLVTFHYGSSKIIIGYTVYLNNSQQFYPITSIDTAIKILYPNGSILMHVPLKKQLMEGLLAIYYDNGQPYIHMDIEGGFIKSKLEAWSALGQQLISEPRFLGELHGNQQYYLENGTLINNIPYYYGEFMGKYLSTLKDNSNFEFIIE